METDGYMDKDGGTGPRLKPWYCGNCGIKSNMRHALSGKARQQQAVTSVYPVGSDHQLNTFFATSICRKWYALRVVGNDDIEVLVGPV